MSMTTVGEMKRRIDSFPDTVPLEFWAVIDGRQVLLRPLPNGESVRFPARQTVEIVLSGSFQR